MDLPHDWSIEDLPPLSASQTPSLAVTAGPWRFTLGDDPGWKEPSFDDAAWQAVTLPTHWSTHVSGDFTQKFGWYRRRISVPAALRGKDVLLLLGKIDDADETFVNGVKVGGTGSFPPNYATAWTDTRRYLVPARLLKGDGTDLVAVRDYNGAGTRAFTRPPRPRTGAGRSTPTARAGRPRASPWRRRLVSQDLPPARRPQRQAPERDVRRRVHGLSGLVQRAPAGDAPLRLHGIFL